MDTGEDWDFYPCRVDDAPASIFVNLALIRVAPLDLQPTLLWIGLQIMEPGDHGMGVEPDVSALYDAEDRIIASAQAQGMRYVGRLRNHGDWQLCFYGRAEHEAQLGSLAEAGLAGQRRGFRTGAKHDATWSYYTDFLFPPPERFQWIKDRRLVDQLRAHGDEPSMPRVVDHFVVFAAGKNTEPFQDRAITLGFEVSPRTDPESGEIGIELRRSDVLEGLHIHDVVMTLVELAEAHGGIYDGWGCPVMKPGG